MVHVYRAVCILMSSGSSPWKPLQLANQTSDHAMEIIPQCHAHGYVYYCSLVCLWIKTSVSVLCSGSHIINCLFVIITVLKLSGIVIVVPLSCIALRTLCLIFLTLFYSEFSTIVLLLISIMLEIILTFPIIMLLRYSKFSHSGMKQIQKKITIQPNTKLEC